MKNPNSKGKTEPTKAKVAANRHEAVPVEELLKRPTISAEQLYKANLIPVSRASIYDACVSGEIESFRIGRRIVIPTAPLRKKLGLEAA